MERNKEVNNLSTALKDIQAICIGLFKPKYSTTWQLVIKAERYDSGEGEKYFITSLSIGKLFGLQYDNTGTLAGTYIPFPEDKTLSQMMDTPSEFQEWCNDNNIK